jgi:hypothetical protein
MATQVTAWHPFAELAVPLPKHEEKKPVEIPTTAKEG